MKEPRIRVAGILIKDEKILFIEHQKNKQTYYLLPGGGVDYGENLQDSLKREFKEEVNLDIEVKEMLFISESIAPNKERHIVNMFFKVEYVSGELSVGEEEILKGAEYLSIKEFNKEVLYPNMKKELTEYLKKPEMEIKYLGNRWE